MMHALDWRLVFLFGAGLFSGWVDSIAGGGGVISLPALLAAGLSPLGAVATNKIAATCGSSTATVRYLRTGISNASPGRWRRALLYPRAWER